MIVQQSSYFLSHVRHVGDRHEGMSSSQSHSGEVREGEGRKLGKEDGVGGEGGREEGRDGGKGGRREGRRRGRDEGWEERKEGAMEGGNVRERRGNVGGTERMSGVVGRRDKAIGER